MVIDSSALLAVLLGEPERPAMLRAILGDRRRMLGAVNRLETAIVLAGRRGPAALPVLDRLLEEAAVQTVAFTPEQAALAQSAWERYGKGRHPAALNLGDCCAYALARAFDEPLLYKGRDFGRTDIPAVTF